MLLYLCLLLLPALAQAACKNATAVVRFCDSVDANGNGDITSEECDAVIQALDDDGDGAVTVDEARKNGDPAFTDYDKDEIFRFLDRNKDGYFTTKDKDLIFGEADKNEDGRLSRREYTKFIREQCQTDKSTTTTDYYN
ncbi:hypothetical protein BsWGS_07034 [Bradybaena similaris]